MYFTFLSANGFEIKFKYCTCGIPYLEKKCSDNLLQFTQKENSSRTIINHILQSLAGMDKKSIGEPYGVFVNFRFVFQCWYWYRYYHISLFSELQYTHYLHTVTTVPIRVADPYPYGSVFSWVAGFESRSVFGAGTRPDPDPTGIIALQFWFEVQLNIV